MKTKSILWILNGCGLEGRGITGGPVRFYEISKRFAMKGYVQHVLTTLGGYVMQTALGCQLPMTIVPASLFLRNEPCRMFRFWSYLVTSLLWRFRASKLPHSDVVVTVSDYFCDIIPALALKKRTNARWIALIYHCETNPKERPGSGFVNAITYRMQCWSFKRIANKADFAWISDTSAGDEIEQRLLAFGMPKSRIHRVQNGINLSDITREKENLPAATDAPHLSPNFDCVMIGVRPNKGLYDIIPIWERVQKLRPGTTLLLMGGMSGEGDVVKEIAMRKLPITVFKPENSFLPAKDYYAKIKEAKILFAPSHEEGWGIAVCEAMAAGLPVVAYDLPTYRKIFNGAYTAVPCYDFDAFAELLVKTLDNPSEFVRLQNLGNVCARKYDWDAIATADSIALNQ